MSTRPLRMTRTRAAVPRESPPTGTSLVSRPQPGARPRTKVEGPPTGTSTARRLQPGAAPKARGEGPPTGTSPAQRLQPGAAPKAGGERPPSGISPAQRLQPGAAPRAPPRPRADANSRVGGEALPPRPLAGEATSRVGGEALPLRPLAGEAISRVGDETLPVGQPRTASELVSPSASGSASVSVSVSEKSSPLCTPSQERSNLDDLPAHLPTYLDDTGIDADTSTPRRHTKDLTKTRSVSIIVKKLPTVGGSRPTRNANKCEIVFPSPTYQCCECPNTFRDHEALLTHHRKTHGPITPFYRCRVCEALYSDLRMLTKVCKHSNVRAVTPVSGKPVIAGATPDLDTSTNSTSPNEENDPDETWPGLQDADNLTDSSSDASEYLQLSTRTSTPHQGSAKMKPTSTSPPITLDTRETLGSRPVPSLSREGVLMFPAEIYSCPFCGSSMSQDYNAVLKHIRRQHADIHPAFQCRQCGIIKDSVQKLKKACKHKQIKLSPKGLFPCNKCPRKFPSPRALTQHMRQAHPSVLGKPTPTRNKTSKIAHLPDNHVPDSPLQCPFCLSAWPTLDSLQVHIREDHRTQTDTDDSHPLPQDLEVSVICDPSTNPLHIPDTPPNPVVTDHIPEKPTSPRIMLEITTGSNSLLTTRLPLPFTLNEENGDCPLCGFSPNEASDLTRHFNKDHRARIVVQTTNSLPSCDITQLQLQQAEIEDTLVVDRHLPSETQQDADGLLHSPRNVGADQERSPAPRVDQAERSRDPPVGIREVDNHNDGDYPKSPCIVVEQWRYDSPNDINQTRNGPHPITTSMNLTLDSSSSFVTLDEWPKTPVAVPERRIPALMDLVLAPPPTHRAPKRQRDVSMVLDSWESREVWAGKLATKINHASRPRELDILLGEFLRIFGPPRPEKPRKAVVEPTTRQEMQAMYNNNPRGAYELLTQGTSPICHIPPTTILSHFRFDTPSIFPATPRPTHCTKLPLGDFSKIMDPFTPDTIIKFLKTMPASAPGPDGITLQKLRENDPQGEVLSALFNKWLTLGRVPEKILQARTIFLYKKGDQAFPSNWRPITIGNTVYRAFAGILAKRLTTALQAVFSPYQTGFTPNIDGCTENTFLVQLAMERLRQVDASGHMIWLDVENAFGSVPHAAISLALEEVGAPPSLRSTIDSIYRASTTSLTTTRGSAPNVPLRRGVKQGCPLSGPLFNLIMEWTLKPLQDRKYRGLQLYDEHVTHLAYCDDIVLLAEHRTSAQRMLNDVSSALAWVGLTVNPAKCAYISSVTHSTQLADIHFSMNNQRIPAATQAHSYLGTICNLVPYTSPPDGTLSKLLANARHIQNSRLTPLQKLTCVQKFILPEIDYSFRICAYPFTQLRKTQKQFDSILKAIACLPARANNNFLHAPRAVGGLGVSSLPELHCALYVATRIKLLNSPRTHIRNLARQSLRYTATHALRDHSTIDQKVLRYLADPSVLDRHGQSSAWSHTRQCSTRLRNLTDMTWGIRNEAFLVRCKDPETRLRSWIPQHKTLTSIKRQLEDWNLQRWLAKPNQGKTGHLVRLHPASSRCLYQNSDDNALLWSFTHKARLNLLPLNGTMPGCGGSTRCRRCPAAVESLPHTLNHCKQNMQLITKRHDKILQRIVNALRKPGRRFQTNRPVPNTNSRLRPDIVMYDGKSTTLLDIAIPFENGPEAFQERRQEKMSKYRPLAAELQRQGHTVHIGAIIVGSLGAWDPENDPLLYSLGVSTNYMRLCRELCSADTLRSSASIYHHHIRKTAAATTLMQPPLPAEATNRPTHRQTSRREHRQPHQADTRS